MSEAIFGLAGVVVGNVTALIGHWLSARHQAKQAAIARQHANNETRYADRRATFARFASAMLRMQRLHEQFAETRGVYRPEYDEVTHGITDVGYEQSLEDEFTALLIDAPDEVVDRARAYLDAHYVLYHPTAHKTPTEPPSAEDRLEAARGEFIAAVRRAIGSEVGRTGTHR